MLRHNGAVPTPIPDPADSAPERTRTPWLEQPTWIRRSAYAALSLLLVITGFAVAGVIVVRRPLPQTDGNLQIAGLAQKVTVLRDGQGVPQIYAENTDDLFFAQGFVQAQDRFWQMDVARHLTAGRLSELFGASTLKSDELVRAMGWRKVAEQEYGLLAPETRDYLAAFTDGVNAYLQDRSVYSMSAEYTALGLSGLDYEAAAWNPVDSLAYLKAMAWELRANMEDEVDRANLEPRLNDHQLSELFPEYPYETNKTIMEWPAQTSPPPGATQRRTPEQAAEPTKPTTKPVSATSRDLDQIPSLFGSGDGIGSNSFVVSGRLTDTGMPYLENDPHLTTTQPGVWYQMGLHCTEVTQECPFDVSGFTIAGFPGVVVGQNQDIAWGLANLRADTTDLYLEKIEGQSALYDGELEPLDKHDEVIRIRGRRSKVFTVRSTRHGPLLSDISRELSSVGANAAVPESTTVRPTAASMRKGVRPTAASTGKGKNRKKKQVVEVAPPERGNGYAVALAWTALQPRPTADAIFMFNEAENFLDFREAAKRLSAVPLSLTYADVDGNIGYQTNGEIPLRNWGHTGRVPVPGWTPDYNWAGFIDFDRLPSELNPTEGFIVAANQAPVPQSYPHLLGSSYDHGWRAQRIRDLLTSKISRGPVTMSDMLEISSDTLNPIGEQLTELLLDQLIASAYYSDGQRLLLSWDYKQPSSSGAAAYFNAVWDNLMRLTFHDQLPRAQWPDGGDRWITVMKKLLEDDYNLWWDDRTTDHIIEDRDTILYEAMLAARDDMTRSQAVDPSKWQWGRSHGLELRNDMLGKRGNWFLDALFNRGPYPVSGGNGAVLSTNWDARSGFEVTSGPSMRMVVDLKDRDNSRWVNAAGQSGHLASGNYTDQARAWAAGKTFRWATEPRTIEKLSTKKLVLIPRR
jgi:penicillin amidase